MGPGWTLSPSSGGGSDLPEYALTTSEGRIDDVDRSVFDAHTQAAEAKIRAGGGRHRLTGRAGGPLGRWAVGIIRLQSGVAAADAWSARRAEFPSERSEHARSGERGLPGEHDLPCER
jgi:hypothetical protein